MAAVPATDSLEELARQFRAAIIAGDHVSALRLSDGYVAALRGFWETLPDPKRAVSPLPAQARDLMEWARGATLIQRTMVADQLDVIGKASLYQARAPEAAKYTRSL